MFMLMKDAHMYGWERNWSNMSIQYLFPLMLVICCNLGYHLFSNHVYKFVSINWWPFHNKKRSIHNIPDRYCMNLSDIIAINICKQGSDNMQIAICDDEVSMVQILEEKIKKLLPDAVIDKYLSGDELIASGSKLFGKTVFLW